jgi:hypothetical protein
MLEALLIIANAFECSGISFVFRFAYRRLAVRVATPHEGKIEAKEYAQSVRASIVAE